MALEALAEVPTIAYDHISSRLEEVGKITVKFLTDNVHEQTRSILNFWNNLSVEESAKAKINMSQNLIG